MCAGLAVGEQGGEVEASAARWQRPKNRSRSRASEEQQQESTGGRPIVFAGDGARVRSVQGDDGSGASDK